MSDPFSKAKRSPIPLAYSVEAACKLAGLSDSTVYSEIAARRLRVKKRGATTLVLRKDLLAFILARP